MLWLLADAVPRLACSDPTFALAAPLGLTARSGSGADAFPLPPWLRSLPALARARLVLANHVGFRPGHLIQVAMIRLLIARQRRRQ